MKGVRCLIPFNPPRPPLTRLLKSIYELLIRYSVLYIFILDKLDEREMCDGKPLLNSSILAFRDSVGEVEGLKIVARME